MAEAGKKHRVYMVTGSSTNTAIVGELSSNWTVNGNVIDISDKDSEWFKGMMGNKSWEASASFSYQKGSNQEQLFESLKAGSQVSLFIGEVAACTQTSGVLGNALVASIAVTNDDADRVTWDVSFTGVGELQLITTPTTTVAPTTTLG